MSRRGDCWDNSAIESFLATSKKERVYRTVYRDRDAARADLFDYIEMFYNSGADIRRSVKSAHKSSNGLMRA